MSETPVTETPAPTERPTWESLGISDTALKAVRDAGYEFPTAVQAEAIPVALDGDDVIA